MPTPIRRGPKTACPEPLAPRVAATLVAVGLNGLLFGWVLMTVPATPPRAAMVTEPLRIVWISRQRVTTPRTVQPARAVISTPRPRQGASAPSPTVSQTSPADTGAPAAPAGTLASDAWQPVARAHGSPPGSIESGFRRNPLERPRPDALEVAPRVRFTMGDGSVFGRLSALSFASHCAHLRKLARGNDEQLAENYTTRDSVYRTMVDEGCAP